MGRKKTPPRPSVTCGTCGGVGHVPLSPVYAATLDILRSIGCPVTSAQMAPHAQCKPTAMNQRLAKLEELGFATSTGSPFDARIRLYTAKEPT